MPLFPVQRFAMNEYLRKRYLNDVHYYMSKKSLLRSSSTISLVEAESPTKVKNPQKVFGITLDLLTFRKNAMRTFQELIKILNDDLIPFFNTTDEAIHFITSLECNLLNYCKQCIAFLDHDLKMLKEKYVVHQYENDIDDGLEVDAKVDDGLIFDDIPPGLLQNMKAYLDKPTLGSDETHLMNMSEHLSSPRMLNDLSLKEQILRTKLQENDFTNQVHDYDMDVLAELPDKESLSSVNISLNLSSNASIIIPKSSVLRISYADSQENKHTLSKHYIHTDECYVAIPIQDKQIVDEFVSKRKHIDNTSDIDDKGTDEDSRDFLKLKSTKRKKCISLTSSSSSDYYSSLSCSNLSDNSWHYTTSTSTCSELDPLGEIPDENSIMDTDTSSNLSYSQQTDHKGIPITQCKKYSTPVNVTSHKKSWLKDTLLESLEINSEKNMSQQKMENSSMLTNMDVTSNYKKLKLKKSKYLEKQSADDDDFLIALESSSANPIETNTEDTEVELKFSISCIPMQMETNLSSQEGKINKKGRRNIKEIISEEELNLVTRVVHEEEKARIERIEAKQRNSESQLSNLCSNTFLQTELFLDTNQEHPIVVHSGLAQILLPHQREGVQFLWNNCYESVERLQAGDKGSGCILAHCMGLGKTLQVVTLVHTLFKHSVTNTRKVLVICPLSTMPNWRTEFRRAIKIVNEHNSKLNIFHTRESVSDWNSHGGVMIMGYHSFLSSIRRGISANIASLLDPGPNLIVCDEGHLLKSRHSNLAKVIAGVKTQRRIILTGTPMQNNLDEYYYMVGIIKPKYLGTKKEYRNRFVNPINNGQFENSSVADIQMMKKRSHILHKMTRHFIQRYEESELSQHLPEKYDYAMMIEINDVQSNLLKKFLDICKYDNLFANLTIIRAVITHPHLLQLHADAAEQNQSKKGKRSTPTELQAEKELRSIDPYWWKGAIPDDSATNINYGSKLVLMMSIVKETMALKEKLLIFSTSLLELDLIEFFLKQSDANWVRERNYCRLDGNVMITLRAKYCAAFNSSSSEIKLMLLTPKVGGLGLNLFGANRAILMDISWNPAHDTQSVFRIYRLGQKKTCYIYRFIAKGTTEEVIYERSVTKQAIAGRVVDERQVMRHFQSTDLEALYRYKMTNLLVPRPMPKPPQDTVLANLLKVHKCIYTYHDHKELLQNRPDEELGEAEMKLAWEEYEREKSVLPLCNAVPPESEPHTSISFVPQQEVQLNLGPSALSSLPLNLSTQMPTSSTSKHKTHFNTVAKTSTSLNPAHSESMPTQVGASDCEYLSSNDFTLNPVQNTITVEDLKAKLIIFESPEIKGGKVLASFDAQGKINNNVQKDKLTIKQLETGLKLPTLPAHKLSSEMYVITRNGLLQELISADKSNRETCGATANANKHNRTVQVAQNVMRWHENIASPRIDASINLIDDDD